MVGRQLSPRSVERRMPPTWTLTYTASPSIALPAASWSRSALGTAADPLLGAQHLAQQNQERLPFLDVEVAHAGDVVEQLAQQLRAKPPALGGQHQVLDAPVVAVDLAPRQTARLERVGDGGDERPVTVDARAEFLHGYGAVDQPQRLGAGRRQVEGLDHSLPVSPHAGEELDQTVDHLFGRLPPGDAGGPSMPPRLAHASQHT